jgi:UDP-glucose:(heptosyl)LPS alpha-1,3-glucosyltransferase
MPGLDVYYAADPCYAAKVEESKSAFYRLSPRFRAFRRQEEAVFHRGAGTEILLIAHAEREKFIRHYGTETERFHLLPPGINRKRLDEVADAGGLRQELGVSSDERVLLAVGSRFHTKGVDRVIRALAALPPALRQGCRLVVVGHGKEGAYRLLARRLGVGEQVRFTGTREDVPRFYRAADLLIHAPRSENTGTVLLEAMICGLPVLVTGNCGFAHYVTDAEAGRVVAEPFNQQRLDAALNDCLSGGELARWRENGPRFCDRTDLYGLINQAAERIIQRARKQV